MDNRTQLRHRVLMVRWTPTKGMLTIPVYHSPSSVDPCKCCDNTPDCEGILSEAWLCRRVTAPQLGAGNHSKGAARSGPIFIPSLHVIQFTSSFRQPTIDGLSTPLSGDGKSEARLSCTDPRMLETHHLIIAYQPDLRLSSFNSQTRSKRPSRSHNTCQ